MGLFSDNLVIFNYSSAANETTTNLFNILPYKRMFVSLIKM